MAAQLAHNGTNIQGLSPAKEMRGSCRMKHQSDGLSLLFSDRTSCCHAGFWPVNVSRLSLQKTILVFRAKWETSSWLMQRTEAWEFWILWKVCKRAFEKERRKIWFVCVLVWPFLCARNCPVWDHKVEAWWPRTPSSLPRTVNCLFVCPFALRPDAFVHVHKISGQGLCFWWFYLPEIGTLATVMISQENALNGPDWIIENTQVDNVVKWHLRRNHRWVS